MKTKYQGKKANTIIWASGSIISMNTVFLTLFGVFGVCIFSFMSSLFPPKATSPKYVPTFKSRLDCYSTDGKVWAVNKCLDA